MKEYKERKEGFEDLTEEEKRYQVDKLLDDLKLKSGFTVTDVKYSDTRANSKSDIQGLLAV